MNGEAWVIELSNAHEVQAMHLPAASPEGVRFHTDKSEVTLLYGVGKCSLFLPHSGCISQQNLPPQFPNRAPTELECGRSDGAWGQRGSGYRVDRLLRLSARTDGKSCGDVMQLLRVMRLSRRHGEPFPC